MTAKNNASYAAGIKYCLFSPSNSSTAIGSVTTLSSSVAAGGTASKSGIYVSGYKLAYVGIKATKSGYADSTWNKYLAGIYANPTVSIANASTATQRKVKVTVTNPNPVAALAIIYLYNSSGTSQGSTTTSIAANSSYSWTKDVSSGTYYGRAYFSGSGYVTSSSYVNSSNITPTLAANKLVAPVIEVYDDSSSGQEYDIVIYIENNNPVDVYCQWYERDEDKQELYDDNTFISAGNYTEIHMTPSYYGGLRYGGGSLEVAVEATFSDAQGAGYNDSDTTYYNADVEDWSE